MNAVVLHGSLAEQFGANHFYHVDTPAEAVRALIANKRGFKDALEKMEVRLIRSKAGVETGMALDVEMLEMGLSGGEIHIIPVIAGSKQEGGAGKAILGVILIAAVIMTAGGASPFAAGAFGAGGAYAGLAGNVLLGGFAMALGGVSMMLAPTPKPEGEQKGSFLFNGATNVAAQGGPVPLVFGLMLTGSTVASLSITEEQVAVSRDAEGPYVGFWNGGGGVGFGDLFGGDVISGTFTGIPGTDGGSWDVEETDNSLVAVTRLNLVD